MCTAVVGGSIHRAATRSSAANDQRSTTPRRNHRAKDRRVCFRCGGFGGMSGISVTLQNNRLGWIEIAGDGSRPDIIEDRTDFTCTGTVLTRRLDSIVLTVAPRPTERQATPHSNFSQDAARRQAVSAAGCQSLCKVPNRRRHSLRYSRVTQVYISSTF